MGSGIRKVILCSVAACGAATAGALFLIDWKATARQYQTGTIQIARQGSSCERLVIDNVTGAITSRQQVPCGNMLGNAPGNAAGDALKAPSVTPAPSTLSAPPRYSSGARIEAIRDHFRGK
ncbi:MAG: hypothetical protein K2Y71_15315 [Xanthobacteraceae bacterium]|nr:hypothetical protein [Xanthobacteraceae bacterium]